MLDFTHGGDPPSHLIGTEVIPVRCCQARGCCNSARVWCRRGEDFYQQRAEETSDPFERTFYRRLAEEEIGHLRNIEDAIELLENPDGFFLQREASVRSL